MKRELAALLVLVSLGMCLRYAHTARNFVVSPDSTEYLRTAVAFEREGGAALKVSLRQPLYPLTLWTGGRAADALSADFTWRAHEMAEVGRVLGVLLYLPFLAACWFFFRRFVAATPAAVCLVVVILHPLFGSRFANVLSETLYLTFFVAGLACMSLVIDGKRHGEWLWAGMTGLCAVLAYLVRVEGQLLLFSALLCFLFLGTSRSQATERRGWLSRAKAAGCCIAGFSVPALPAMAYLGVTSNRYGWEWLWERLTGPTAAQVVGNSGAAFAGLGLVASPLQSIGMLLAALIEEAPVIAFGALALAAIKAVGRWRARLSGTWRASHTAVIFTLVLYASAIVIGASLRLGTVSMRYVQPLVLIVLPMLAAVADALFGNKVRNTIRTQRAFALVVVFALAAYAAAFADACRQWDRYKTGYREAGIAVEEAAESASLITSSPRLSYYSGSGIGPVEPERLKAEILGGGAAAFEFAGVETKRYEAGEFRQIQQALSKHGFGARPWFDAGETAGSENRILVYRREPAGE